MNFDIVNRDHIGLFNALAAPGIKILRKYQMISNVIAFVVTIALSFAYLELAVYLHRNGHQLSFGVETIPFIILLVVFLVAGNVGRKIGVRQLMKTVSECNTGPLKVQLNDKGVVMDGLIIIAITPGIFSGK